MTNRLSVAVAATLLAAAPLVAGAQSDEELINTVEPAYEEGGRYFTEHDIPTYQIDEDGTVDWPTFSGFRRYHSECHVCHGPDGMGSTYAPPIKDAVMDMTYYEFMAAVASGQNLDGSGNSVMPALGDNRNVMCYIDDIYTYLRARGTDAIPRGRPQKKDRPSETFREAEDACMG